MNEDCYHPVLVFLALYRGSRNGESDKEIVVIAPSWKRAAEIAEEHASFFGNYELIDLSQLTSDGALIDIPRDPGQKAE